jgi:hypothetical protein
MFAQAEKKISQLVVGQEFIVGGMSGEDNISETQSPDNPLEKFIVIRRIPIVSQKDEMGFRLD